MKYEIEQRNKGGRFFLNTVQSYFVMFFLLLFFTPGSVIILPSDAYGARQNLTPSSFEDCMRCPKCSHCILGDDSNKSGADGGTNGVTGGGHPGITEYIPENPLKIIKDFKIGDFCAVYQKSMICQGFECINKINTIRNGITAGTPTERAKQFLEQLHKDPGIAKCCILAGDSIPECCIYAKCAINPGRGCCDALSLSSKVMLEGNGIPICNVWWCFDEITAKGSNFSASGMATAFLAMGPDNEKKCCNAIKEYSSILPSAEKIANACVSIIDAALCAKNFIHTGKFDFKQYLPPKKGCCQYIADIAAYLGPNSGFPEKSITSICNGGLDIMACVKSYKNGEYLNKTCCNAILTTTSLIDELVTTNISTDMQNYCILFQDAKDCMDNWKSGNITNIANNCCSGPIVDVIDSLSDSARGSMTKYCTQGLNVWNCINNFNNGQTVVPPVCCDALDIIAEIPGAPVRRMKKACGGILAGEACYHEWVQHKKLSMQCCGAIAAISAFAGSAFPETTMTTICAGGISGYQCKKDFIASGKTKVSAACCRSLELFSDLAGITDIRNACNGIADAYMCYRKYVTTKKITGNCCNAITAIKLIPGADPDLVKFAEEICTCALPNTPVCPEVQCYNDFVSNSYAKMDQTCCKILDRIRIVPGAGPHITTMENICKNAANAYRCYKSLKKSSNNDCSLECGSCTNIGDFAICKVKPTDPVCSTFAVDACDQCADCIYDNYTNITQGCCGLQDAIAKIPGVPPIAIDGIKLICGSINLCAQFPGPVCCAYDAITGKEGIGSNLAECFVDKCLINPTMDCCERIADITTTTVDTHGNRTTTVKRDLNGRSLSELCGPIRCAFSPTIECCKKYITVVPECLLIEGKTCE